MFEEYIDAILKREKALETGNARVANRYYDKIADIIDKLKEENTKELMKLKPLLEHEEVSVRFTTAFYLLQIIPEDAERILEDISQTRNRSSFEAEMTLREWRKGNISFKSRQK